MIESRIQRKIPIELGHHTNFKALKSILSNSAGKGKEICLWAFSNMTKNDPEEIKMGLRLQVIVDEKLKNISNSSMFQKASGYKNSASLSFMEGESSDYMMSKYGRFRLNFDLREVEDFGLADFLDCEYVKTEELEDYGNEYADVLDKTLRQLLEKKDCPERFSPGHILKVIGYLNMDIDLVRKPLVVKEYKWHQESEWKIIFR